MSIGILKYFKISDIGSVSGILIQDYRALEVSDICKITSLG